MATGLDRPQHLLAMDHGSVALTVHGSGRLLRLQPPGDCWPLDRGSRRGDAGEVDPGHCLGCRLTGIGVVAETELGHAGQSVAELGRVDA